MQAVFTIRMLYGSTTPKSSLTLMNHHIQNQQKLTTHGYPEEKVTQLSMHIEKAAWIEYSRLQLKGNKLLC